jgi:hypothetical protein
MQTLLQKLFSRRPAARYAGVRPACRLELETLEERTVLDGSAFGLASFGAPLDFSSFGALGSSVAPLDPSNFSLGVDTNLFTPAFNNSNALTGALIALGGSSSPLNLPPPDLYSGPQFVQGFPPAPGIDYGALFNSGLNLLDLGANLYSIPGAIQSGDANGLAGSLNSIVDNPLVQGANNFIGTSIVNGTNAASDFGNNNFGFVINPLSDFGAGLINIFNPPPSPTITTPWMYQGPQFAPAIDQGPVNFPFNNDTSSLDPNFFDNLGGVDFNNFDTSGLDFGGFDASSLAGLSSDFGDTFA